MWRSVVSIAVLLGATWGATQTQAAITARQGGDSESGAGDVKVTLAESATTSKRSSLAVGARLQRLRMEQEKSASTETKASAPKP